VDVWFKDKWIEKVIAEEADAWAQDDPITFNAFRTAMDQARGDLKQGTIGRVEFKCPEGLNVRVANRLADKDGIPDFRWLAKEEYYRAFKRVFLIGMLAPVEQRVTPRMVVPIDLGGAK
jgi:hypothetical protein